MSNKNSKRSGGAGTAAGLAYLLIWTYAIVFNHTKGRTREILLRLMRIAFYSCLSFMILAVVISLPLIFLPSLMESLFEAVIYGLGLSSYKFTDLFSWTMILLSMASGSAWELHHTFFAKDYYFAGYPVFLDARPVIYKAPPQAITVSSNRTEYTSVDSNTTTCEYCGFPLTDGYKLCPNCGTKVK